MTQNGTMSKSGLSHPLTGGKPPDRIQTDMSKIPPAPIISGFEDKAVGASPYVHYDYTWINGDTAELFEADYNQLTFGITHFSAVIPFSVSMKPGTKFVWIGISIPTVSESDKNKRYVKYFNLQDYGDSNNVRLIEIVVYDGMDVIQRINPSLWNFDELHDHTFALDKHHHFRRGIHIRLVVSNWDIKNQQQYGIIGVGVKNEWT